jgi:glycosyltransferase involved in cell wall biosynthesis
MKIGILIDQLIPGGVQKTAIEEVKYLKSQGHEVTLLVLMRTPKTYAYEDITENIIIRFISDEYPRFLQKNVLIPPFTFFSTQHLLSPFLSPFVIKKNSYDLIVSHGTTTSITALALSTICGIPYITIVWDPLLFILTKVYKSSLSDPIFQILKLILKQIEKIFLIHAKYVYTPSQVHTKLIAEVYKMRADILYPGFHPARIPRSRQLKYFLSYTRWQLAKEPVFLLQLAALFPRQRFIIAGAWTSSVELRLFREKIRMMQLRNVTLVLAVNRKKLSQLAASAIAFIHPNYESFGMTALEMAGHGVPIIVPYGSGVTELFTHAQDGFFPSEHNLKQFAQAITALTKPKYARQMGSHAFGTAQAYTWEHHGQQLARLLHSLVRVTPGQITVLANAFVSKKSIGGGDRFLMEVVPFLPVNLSLQIITPKIGYYHWQKRDLLRYRCRFTCLRQSLFDNRTQKIFIFVAYFLRTLETIFIVFRRRIDFMYSSTEIFPDVIPAYINKLRHKNSIWVARIYHLIPLPIDRSGNLVTNIFSYLLQQLSLFLIRSADKILVDNPLLVDVLAGEGFARKHIEVHFGGAPYQRISRYKVQHRYTYNAAVIGRLAPHKGTEDIIPIWKKVLSALPTARVALVGGGDPAYEQRLQQTISARGLGNQIQLLGFIHHREEEKMPLFDLLKSVKVLLFLDHEAGFGLSVSEALACGVPVVAYNLPIFKEVYTHGVMTVPLKDTERFSQQVIKLLGDQRLYKTMSREAKEEAKKFDWEIQARKLFKSLMNLYP